MTDKTIYSLKETNISHGGLMRCCLATINELTEGEYENGTIIDCKYEPKQNNNIILKDGVWKWNNGNEGFGK